tara:strand:+ start:506 stop:763 length:258 start_codon:yes stop_codon:yes gene_type:complete
MKKLVNNVSVEMTAHEIEEHEAATPTALLEAYARERRDLLLSQTDWMANSDVTMSAQWRTYRAALRNLPAQAGFPTSLTWPTEPS